MKLSELISALDNYKLYGSGECLVKNIIDDSRKIGKGSLFVAIKGLRVNGHSFISQSIKSGAVAVAGEDSPKKFNLGEATYIKVTNSRKALGLLASRWYNDSHRKLKVIGITGTDGKTTTANLIYWILKRAGRKAGLISTVSAKIGNKEYNTGFHVTNPEPLLLQKFLALMVKRDCEYAVLEVTSHGLDQERVAGINFAVGVLTNITHEHIDYHKTYRNYLRAKSKIFINSQVAVLNRNDSSYRKIIPLLSNKVRVLSYSRDSLSGRVKKTVTKRFSEPYNQQNAAAAVKVAKLLEIDEKDIVQSIKSFPGVPGRTEEIKNKKRIRIIVDFAHTPNALDQVLSMLKKQKKKNTRLIAVFGCAGERDVKKRPMMGEISARLADISVFTAEDPRSEDVNRIINQIVTGAKRAKSLEFERSGYFDSSESNRHIFIRIPERGKAIYFAINKLAKRGDIVVICGKGHEKSIAYENKEYPWSDQEAVKKALSGRIMVIRKPKKTAILGLGIEGKDLVKFLLKGKALITILDEKPEKELDFTGINRKKLKTTTGAHYLNGLSGFDIIYRSPGVYRYKKEIVEAEKNGSEISSALKLFFDLCPAKIIGVTGTKGKGTTSTLIYEILKKEGKDVYLVGNIGKPYLNILPRLKKNSWVILELSSFQLIDLTRSPHIAVVLNVTSDHLDWHRDQKEYIEAKKNIVKFQKSEDHAIINKLYKIPLSFTRATIAKKHFFAKFRPSKKLLLRGEHNLENIAAAILASKLAGASKTTIEHVIYGFKGLEHRLELAGKAGGISFYNDSFATGPQPTIAAIRSFSEHLTIILGGYDKGLEYRQLAEELAKSRTVSNVILIGDLSEKLRKGIKKANFRGKVINMGKATMSKVVKKAFEVTPQGGIVLFSPAAASFDMFKNYKERGNRFKEAVRKSNK